MTASALRKAGLRLVPFLGLLYFVSFLDRVNVGFAALTMNADVGLSASAFGMGSGIFFLGYIAFAVPANLMLEKFGAARWLAMISIAWGAVSLCTAFIQTPVQFYAVRLLLGAVESGFLPGVILYLSRWFPDEMRGRIIGGFFMAVPLSNVLGAPLSSWLLGQTVLGLAGWQTMFVVEALPAILLGVIAIFYLSDTPGHAGWLTPEERASLTAMQAERPGTTKKAGLRAGLFDLRVWQLGAIYFLLITGIYGFAFWAPQIFQALGGLSIQQIGWAVAAPYAVAAVAMYFWAQHSDRTGERRWHIAVPLVMAAAGFVLAGATGNLAVVIAGFILALVGLYGAVPVFWTIPTAMLSGAAAASGIALVNSIGNLAGYFGPSIMGWLKESTGSYSVGLQVLAGSAAAAAVLAALLKARKPDQV